MRVSYILRESTYPFLALIVLKQSRMVVCERVEGSVGREELVRRLERAIRDNEGELVVERNERLAACTLVLSVQTTSTKFVSQKKKTLKNLKLFF